MAEMRMQAPHQSAGGLDVQTPHAILALLSPIDIDHVKLTHMGDGRMTSLAAVGGIRTARSRRARGCRRAGQAEKDTGRSRSRPPLSMIEGSKGLDVPVLIKTEPEKGQKGD